MESAETTEEETTEEAPELTEDEQQFNIRKTVAQEYYMSVLKRRIDSIGQISPANGLEEMQKAKYIEETCKLNETFGILFTQHTYVPPVETEDA